MDAAPSVVPILVAASSLIVSCLSLFVAFHANVARLILRRKALLYPIRAFFLVPSNEYHDCEYATQDNDEHRLKEIILPPNSEVTVDITLECLQTFSFTKISIGCIGPLKVKPHAVKYFNRFIESGDGKEIVPGAGNTHYIDKHRYYHVRGQRVCSVGTFIALAFTIKTGAPGLFPVRMFFPGDQVMGSLCNLFHFSRA